MSTTTCPRCKGSGDGATVLLGESADSSPVCGMCVGTGRIALTLMATVKLTSLSNAQLRELLDWEELDLAASLTSTDNERQVLLAAARNRRFPEDLPVSMVPEAA